MKKCLQIQIKYEGYIRLQEDQVKKFEKLERKLLKEDIDYSKIDGLRLEETNIPLSYGSIYNIEGVEYKEVNYTPDMKRNFSIIDSQTGEEVKPSLYKDEVTGQIKGRCKIMPNRPYIVLEVRFEED